MNSLQTLTGLPSNHPSYSQDFSRRFKGGFLLMKDQLIQLTHEIGAFEYECLNLHTKQKFLLNTKDSSPIFDLWIPEMGFYALPFGYIYIYQKPSRQYCRTFNPGSNYKIQISPLRNNMDVYLAIFNKTVHTHKNYNDPDGYVLTNKLLIKFNDYPLSYSLYYLQVPIGTVNITDKTITFKNPMIQQEVQDSLNRIGEFGWTFL